MVWKPGSKHSVSSSRVIARRNDWNSIGDLHQGPRSMTASRGRIHDRSPIRLPKHQKVLAERGPSIHDDLNSPLTVSTPCRISVMDASRRAEKRNFWGMTAHGLFILQCSNYLLLVGVRRSLSRQGAAGVPRQQCRFSAPFAKAEWNQWLWGLCEKPEARRPQPAVGNKRLRLESGRTANVFVCAGPSAGPAGPGRRAARLRPDRGRLRSGRRLVDAGQTLRLCVADAGAAAV